MNQGKVQLIPIMSLFVKVLCQVKTARLSFVQVKGLPSACHVAFGL